MRFLVTKFAASRAPEPEALPWPPSLPGRKKPRRRALPWLVGLLLMVGVVGAGVSMGAPDGGEDLGLRPSPDRGREQVMALLARKEKALEERERHLIDK